MRVITLNKESFRRACNALAGMCGADGYRPDCLVGICKGGVYVADEVADCLVGICKGGVYVAD
ncbi:MAG: hypothetical protein HDT06_04125, partial [Bacteroidales bacterium]|nr:hypothetical protein [Bacteroidales bacterium]